MLISVQCSKRDKTDIIIQQNIFNRYKLYFFFTHHSSKVNRITCCHTHTHAHAHTHARTHTLWMKGQAPSVLWRDSGKPYIFISFYIYLLCDFFFLHLSPAHALGLICYLTPRSPFLSSPLYHLRNKMRNALKIISKKSMKVQISDDCQRVLWWYMYMSLQHTLIKGERCGHPSAQLSLTS